VPTLQPIFVGVGNPVKGEIGLGRY